MNHDYLSACVKTWLSRCGTSMHRHLVAKLYLETFQRSIDQFCDPKGTVRKKFLRHAPCLIEQVKLADTYRASCVRDIQANTEFVHEQAKRDGNLSQFLRGNCCAYNQWEQCITGHLRDKCGQGAADIFPKLIHYTSSNLLLSFCSPKFYNANNATQCPPQMFQAPKNVVPKGFQSSSLISVAFSRLCPNVGFGVDVTKDNLS